MLVHPTPVPGATANVIRADRERQERRAAVIRARRRRQRANRRVQRERIREEAARAYMERVRAFDQGKANLFILFFLSIFDEMKVILFCILIFYLFICIYVINYYYFYLF